MSKNILPRIMLRLHQPKAIKKEPIQSFRNMVTPSSQSLRVPRTVSTPIKLRHHQHSRGKPALRRSNSVAAHIAVCLHASAVPSASRGK